jgi:surface protein
MSYKRYEEKMKTKNKRNYSKEKGITLIALVVTIVVLLILAGVSINALFGQDGIIQRAKDSQNKMNEATQNDLNSINDLDKLISSLTNKTTEEEVPDELERYFLGEDKKGKLIDEMIKEDEEDTIFIGNDIIPDAETSIKFKNVEEGTEESISIKIKYKDDYYIITVDIKTGMTKTVKVAVKTAIFDTGVNVRNGITKAIIQKDEITEEDSLIAGFSVDEIKQYNGTPDLSTMTERNVISMENSDYPIYIWFEKSGKTEIRNLMGEKDLTVEGGNWGSKKVETGTIYWWSKSNNAYLNPDSSQMFKWFPYLTNIDSLKYMKTDYVKNMSQMFSLSVRNLDNIEALSNWDTSNVTDMNMMFYTVDSLLTNVDALVNWNTSKVTDMSGMFAGNNNLTNIDGLKDWNTSNVTNMNEMFGDIDGGGCGITNLSAISNWDVSKVTDMGGMFFNCTKLEDASAISNWNITTIATNMFFECLNLKNITIPSTVTKIESEAFTNNNLTKIKILITDATKFEVDTSGQFGVFGYLPSNSKIYVLSEEIKTKLEGGYDTSKTTVEVVTLDQMNNL